MLIWYPYPIFPVIYHQKIHTIKSHWLVTAVDDQQPWHLAFPEAAQRICGGDALPKQSFAPRSDRNGRFIVVYFWIFLEWSNHSYYMIVYECTYLYLLIYLFIYLSIYLFIHLFIYSSIHISIYIFILYII